MNELPTPDTIKCGYTYSGIPKIIHQTWKTADIPDKWKPTQAKWKELHPDWVYILWTDESIRAYISQFYPEYLELHDSYEYNIQRADMIRYFVLHDFGGIYSDLDQYPKKNIEAYITCNMNYFVLSPNPNIIHIIFNGLMISPRRSLIMKKIQENLKTRTAKWYMSKHHIVPYTTGNIMITEFLFEKVKEPFILLPRKLFNPFSIVQQNHILESDDNIEEAYIDTLTKDSSWNGSDSVVFNFIARHRNAFAAFGIVSLFALISGLIYYVFKYKKCKETCNVGCKIKRSR